MDDIGGMSVLTPYSAAIFLAGLFAVTACPPFGPFFSELAMVRAGFTSGHGVVVGVFLGCLLFAFFGLTRLVFAIVDGRPRTASKKTGKLFPETAGVIAPAVALMFLSIWVGLATPAVLREAWSAAVAQLFPTP